MAAPHEFDPGPVDEPFRSLAADYPGAETYPPTEFRIEWGPVFHRGRLDGSARILLVGQDPGQHESIARRCMVGEAGQRAQGFLTKLGIAERYVIVNAFLYSVYGQPRPHEVAQLLERTAAYRHRWLEALVAGGEVRAVVAFGDVAQKAFEEWLGPPGSERVHVAYEPLHHPTYPEGASRHDPSRKPQLTRELLHQWNDALQRLDPVVGERGPGQVLPLYGEELRPEDRTQIPERDLPAGTPAWMRSLRTWASREDLLPRDKSDEEKAEAKRATVVVRIPRAERSWPPLDA